MTDYKEEQQNELEALESIYPDELQIIAVEPYAVFTISLKSQASEDNEEEEEASCTVQFSYVETYPDEPPVFEITETDNIEDDQVQELLDLMTEQAQENLGMVMVFTLVSAVQEKLSCLVDEAKKRKTEEEERKQKEIEDAEHKKFEGIRCTVENFLAWKTKFDAEMAELNKRKLENDPSKSKLSGKELFLRDASMMDSDVQFLTQEGDDVEVDESLFQDMDDLDIADDELLDDD